MRDTDLETARETLAPAAVVEPPDFGPEAAPEETCPKCGSPDIALEKGSRKTIALLLVTQIVPLWFWRSRVVCRNCGYSRVVPLRFQPEVFFAMLAAAIMAFFALGIVWFIVGTLIASNFPYY